MLNICMYDAGFDMDMFILPTIIMNPGDFMPLVEAPNQLFLVKGITSSPPTT